MFAIPRKENPYLEGKDIPRAPNSQSGCFRPGDKPIEVTMFSFLPNDLPGYADPYLKDEYGSFFAVRITVRYNLKVNLENRFKSVNKALENNDKKINNLQKLDNFYVSKEKPRTIIFIASENDFLTPQGEPVTFGCSPYGNDNTGSRLICGMSFGWKDNITFYADQINPNLIPRRVWKEFYHNLLIYFENLELKS